MNEAFLRNAFLEKVYCFLASCNIHYRKSRVRGGSLKRLFCPGAIAAPLQSPDKKYFQSHLTFFTYCFILSTMFQSFPKALQIFQASYWGYSGSEKSFNYLVRGQTHENKTRGFIRERTKHNQMSN